MVKEESGVQCSIDPESSQNLLGTSLPCCVTESTSNYLRTMPIISFKQLFVANHSLKISRTKWDAPLHFVKDRRYVVTADWLGWKLHLAAIFISGVICTDAMEPILSLECLALPQACSSASSCSCWFRCVDEFGRCTRCRYIRAKNSCLYVSTDSGYGFTACVATGSLFEVSVFLLVNPLAFQWSCGPHNTCAKWHQ